MYVHVSWVTDGRRHLCSWLRFRVQLLPHSRRQQFKLLCSDLWVVGADGNPIPPSSLSIQRRTVENMFLNATHCTEPQTTTDMTWWSSHGARYHIAAMAFLWHTKKKTLQVFGANMIVTRLTLMAWCLEIKKEFATTGFAEQLMACFEAFWQSTAQELFWYVIKFQSMSQPFKMQRLEFNFEALPLTDPTGEPGPHTRSGLAALVFGWTNNALGFI